MNWREKLDNIDDNKSIEGICHEIMDLTLSSRQIKWNEFGIYIENGMVKGLGLFNKRMEQVPNAVWGLLDLESLNLVNCRLTSLSENLGNLVNLQELYTGGNQFQTIPSSIGNLSNLTTLYLLEDNLKDLPLSISKLNKLRELSISSEIPDFIPKEILQLKKRGCRIYLNQVQMCIMTKYQRNVNLGFNCSYLRKLLHVGRFHQ